MRDLYVKEMDDTAASAGIEVMSEEVEEPEAPWPGPSALSKALDRVAHLLENSQAQAYLGEERHRRLHVNIAMQHREVVAAQHSNATRQTS